MDWQQLTSLCIVAMSTALLVRRSINKRRRAQLRGCGTDCECSAAAKL